MSYKSILAFTALLPALASAQTYTASFTEYGSGDNNGSGNCNTVTYVPVSRRDRRDFSLFVVELRAAITHPQDIAQPYRRMNLV